MPLVRFTSTHNQDVYVNPLTVLYAAHFEEEVTVIAFAVAGSGGKPLTLYVRGALEQVRLRLEGKAPKS